MKQFKTLVALVLAVMMVVGTMGLALATVTPAAITTGSITVNNAVRGETYYAIKALDAIVSADGITYTGTIPEQLTGVLEVKTITVGEAPNPVYSYQAIAQKDNVTAEAYATALRNFATAQKSNWGEGQQCTGNSVQFSALDPGFYVIVSTLGDEDTNKVSAASTFSSSTPHTADGVVYEKNETTPDYHKNVGKTSYSIGDTIEYTVDFLGLNYMGSGENAQIVTEYHVTDTLPEFLSGVQITHVYLGDGTTNDILSELDATAFNAKTGDLIIPWATGSNHNYTSKYTNGTKVTIVYTATLTNIVNVNIDNTNKVTITPYVDKPEGPGPWDEPWEDTEVIKTYAAALKKVDEGGNNLAGATFQFKGLTVTQTAPGVYTVVGYNSAATDYTGADSLTVNNNGKIYIVGLASDVTLTGKETVAPAGYNLLTTEFTLQPQQLTEELYKTSGVRYYDAAGNLVAEESHADSTKTKTPAADNLNMLDTAAVSVVNHAGAELPHTGGIGTTIFYVAGIVLVLGAAAIIIARRKAEQQ